MLPLAVVKGPRRGCQRHHQENMNTDRSKELLTPDVTK